MVKFSYLFIILFSWAPLCCGFLLPKIPQKAHRAQIYVNVANKSDSDVERSSLPGRTLTAVQPTLKWPFEQGGQLTELSNDQAESSINKLVVGVEELLSIVGVFSEAVFPWSVTPTDIVGCCDKLENLDQDYEKSGKNNLFLSGLLLALWRRALEFQRSSLLTKLLQQNYDAYVATASFLSPSRIPRHQLPNVQDIPYGNEPSNSTSLLLDANGVPLVADCELDDVKFKESPLDIILLQIFRNLVTEHTGGVTSDKEGIEGLLEQGRTYMLQNGQTPENQHQMVYNTLKSLMTPVLPPFYRLFMSGIIPNGNSPSDAKQLGPWFYAPYLTSAVTPTFFGFLVGPSRPNRRRDGELGGLVVEKCKFLQESGCKGLCLHQCKLPAQQFFAEELGLPLTVTPNFETQECQWSFGEKPIPPSEDPSFPSGCLNGCPSRTAISASLSLEEIRKVDLCNYSA